LVTVGGGVVTRDYKRQYGANAKINRVITIGSPHLGANILVNVENGNIAYLASWGLTQVSKGPLFSLGYPAAIPTLNYTFSQLAPIVTNIAYVESGYSALAHLKPGSSYLTTLNNTSETFQRAGIYGAEYWHRPIRTIGSFLGNENGWVNGWNTGVNIYYSVSYVYAWYFYYYYDLFIYYLNHFQYIPQLLYTALYYANASNLWYDGFLTTYYYFDAIYDIYLGVPYIVSNGIPYLQSGSDGIISIPSQKYPNVISDWNYMAEGANHAEERSNNNVAFRSRDILDRWGIQRR